MSTTPPPPPLPADPRHQRFADLRLRGESLRDAYAGAGYKIDAKSSGNAKRLEKRHDVAAYILAVRRAAADETTLDVLEKRRYLARALRTPLTAIDPEDPAKRDHDLIKKLKRRFTVKDNDDDEPIEYCTEEFEKIDPLKAIQLDNDLAGDGSEGAALGEFSQMLAHMRNTP